MVSVFAKIIHVVQALRRERRYIVRYSFEEILQYVREEDVKFIRLTFCDVFGKQKNVSIMPDELMRALTSGIAFDASSIAGFGDEVRSDLMLHPDPDTIVPLPWRPENGRVIQMFSSISYPDGRQFECDTREFLKKADREAREKGLRFTFGSEQEFYLFRLGDDGRPTDVPHDQAGYMDIAPEDRGENVRREICLTLEKMGIRPEASHHEAGPGQNEIDFRYSDALTAADNTEIFQRVVRTIADRNVLHADFSPKPLDGHPGNGFHINISLKDSENEEDFGHMIAGILANIADITVFLNPSMDSYKRLGSHKAPRYISWSEQNRSQLIRIPAAEGEYVRAELRSPDPGANPYLAFALLIYAAMDGIERKLTLEGPADFNLYTAEREALKDYRKLPETYDEAVRTARGSDFLRRYVPREILEIYCRE